ncbi:MAG: nodulation protein NfeD [Candidatus Kapabacteria bacterium]|nr:nodulation protein NfeD [Candidatus Kapabacteria bacterium]
MRLQRTRTVIGTFLTLLAAGFSTNAVSQSSVVVAAIDGVINPMTATYLDRTLARARELGAECVIIELNTPGGLDRSMRDMVQSLLNSTVPTVVYVTPAGARAASAGVFITMAAHVAAMAPGTNIGAAHPVALGEGGMDSVMEQKVTNDAVAFIRSIAQVRQRNARWAEEAVRRSVSLTAQEALDSNVINLIARDRNDLIAKLRGRTIRTAAGERTLRLDNPQIVEVDMTVLEKFLHTITDPNIALLLLSLGFLAIVIEFYTPGTFGPAIAGVILLILGFMATGSLPINWAGILLIVLAAILLAIELYTPTVGVFAIGSAVAFTVGALLLFSPSTPPSPSMPAVSVSGWLVALIAVLFALVGLVIARAAVGVHRSRPRSGVEALIGAEGIARTNLAPIGTVFVRSEEWSAENVGPTPIAAGDPIIVVGAEGSVLRVERKPLATDS